MTSTNDLQRVAVIGGGVIGGGWVARCLLNGITVNLYDPDPNAAHKIDAIMVNARMAFAKLVDGLVPPEGKLGNGAQTLNTAGMASGLGGMSGDRSRKPPLYAYARNRPSRGWWGGNTSPKLARRDARGRAGRRRVSRLRWMFIALTLWMYGPFIHKIIGGFNKVYMRRWFHPIERPYPCEATALAPKNLVDNSPISNLLPADMTNLPGLRPQQLKVGIITLCDAGVEAICAESTANKQAYADLHGYDLIVDEDIVDKSRPASWSKLLAMRKYLPNYDFVLYIDIDTIIMNPDRRLEDIVDFNYDQMLAADKNGLNCGVWMLRNTPWTLWFIDEMWAQDQLVAPKTWNMLFKYEQRAFPCCEIKGPSINSTTSPVEGR